ncbi:type II/IV secretion system protein [bacterium NHP-B]|nr:type II/IV secretion system protein [bacterium NHP-B]
MVTFMEEMDPFLRDLVDKNVLSEDQAQTVMEEWRVRHTPIDYLCIDMGFVAKDELLPHRARNNHVQLAQGGDICGDEALVQKLTLAFCQQFFVLPLALKESTVHVAMADVTHVGHKDHVQQVCQASQVEVMLADRSDILAALSLYEDHQAARPRPSALLVPFAQGHDAQTPDPRPEVFLRGLLREGVRRGSSDLHFHPRRLSLHIGHRLDGVLHPLMDMNKRHWPVVLAKLKVMSGLEPTEHRKPQQGRMTVNMMGRDIDVRVSTHPSFYGERVAVRILDQEKTLSLQGLGFDARSCETLEAVLSHPQGLVIVTGPTGSGKTTTLHACLRHLSHDSLNIMTLEEPLEYLLPFATQTEVSEDKGFGFAEGVVSALRQDVDVLLVGEVRDEETAHMAMRAAMTGHRVLTSLHAPDALGAIDRLLDLGVSRHHMATHLSCLMAQRLFRPLCEACKKPDEVYSDQHTFIYQAHGCDLCGHTGYRGQRALLDIVTVDAPIAMAIENGMTRAWLKEFLQQKQHRFLTDHAHRYLQKGVMSRQEIRRVLGEDPLTWEQHISGRC